MHYHTIFFKLLAYWYIKECDNVNMKLNFYSELCPKVLRSSCSLLSTTEAF